MSVNEHKLLGTCLRAVGGTRGWRTWKELWPRNRVPYEMAETRFCMIRGKPTQYWGPGRLCLRFHAELHWRALGQVWLQLSLRFPQEAPSSLVLNREPQRGDSSLHLGFL